MITTRIALCAALALGTAALLADATLAAAPPAGAARAAYLAGKRAPEGEERRRHFADGVAAARARLAANPDDPEGLLWLAANLGSEALARSRVSALRVVPEMERLLLRLDAVAPSYDHAAAARTLGRIYHKAPAIISVGSMKKARLWFERALARAGDYPINQILAADFFADDGDGERARLLARQYLAAPVPEANDPDAKEWREIAERILGDEARRRR
jgi:hypothetical protein